MQNTLIPFLDQHINITAISANGNIQYTYNGDDLKNESDTNDPPSPTNDQNSFVPLSNQHSDTESNARQELESILNSESPLQQQKTDTDVYSQALNYTTSTLKNYRIIQKLL